MSNIEQIQSVIEAYDKWIQGAGSTRQPVFSCNKKMTSLIIEALREQAERQKGCRYCQDASFRQKGFYVDNPDGDILLASQCCINCGKRLEVEP